MAAIFFLEFSPIKKRGLRFLFKWVFEGRPYLEYQRYGETVSLSELI